MIPLGKLITLPRRQRLRKAAKIAEEADRQLAFSGRLEPEQAEYLCGMAELLARDEGFSPAQTAALQAACAILAVARPDGNDVRRAIHSVYHILLAETGRYQADWDFIESSGTLDLSKRRPFPGMRVYLEDIRSPFNVGSIFRAAESFGAENLLLSPLCADPRHKRALRTAMGCVDILPWERLSCDPFIDSPAPPVFDSPFFTLETGGIPLEDFQFPPRG
ncbi:MAG: TrmH family RNA methyltransferase, partial [Treponema sp.]|nr:TrmH family RNA methyltransferase [Treponema sp.]